MTALARAMSRAIGIEIQVDILRPVLIFSGSGLLLSLLLILYGYDPSASGWIPPA